MVSDRPDDLAPPPAEPRWNPPPEWAPPPARQDVGVAPPVTAWPPPPPRRPRPALRLVEGRRPPLWVPLLLVAVMVGLAALTWLQGAQHPDVVIVLTQRVWVGELIGAAVVVGIVLVGRWWRSVGYVPRPGAGLAVRLIAVAEAVICLGLVTAAGVAQGVAPRWYVVLAVNVLAIGVLEETVFRGLLWASLPARWPVSRVLLVTSLGFGALHVTNGLVTGDWGTAVLQAIVVTPLGLWLGVVRLRTGWLGASIGLHALHDAASAALVTLTASGVLSQRAAEHLDIPAGVLLAVLAFEAALVTVAVAGVVVWIRLMVDERRAKRAAAPPGTGVAALA